MIVFFLSKEQNAILELLRFKLNFLNLIQLITTTRPFPLKEQKKHKLKYRLLSDYDWQEIEYRIKNYYKMVMVRNPYERLLSAYRDKFENGIKNQTIDNNYLPENKDTYETTTFHEFLTVIVKMNANASFSYDPYLSEASWEFGMKLNPNWAKYTSVCHPCHIHYDHIGKFETFVVYPHPFPSPTCASIDHNSSTSPLILIRG